MLISGSAWICYQTNRLKLHMLLVLSETTSLSRAFTSWHPVWIVLFLCKKKMSLSGTVNQTQFALSLTHPCYRAFNRKGNWSWESRPWATQNHQNRPQSNSSLTSTEYPSLIFFFQLLSIALHKSEYTSRQTNAIIECSKLMRPSPGEIVICNIAFYFKCTWPQATTSYWNDYSQLLAINVVLITQGIWSKYQN